MASLGQKWLTLFCQKDQNFVWLRLYALVLISPACGPNTYQITYEETLTSNVSIKNGNIKCPIAKLPLNLFRATVTNADIGCLKSLHTFL